LIPKQKKIEVWDHIISLPKKDRPKIVTDDNIELIKKDIWQQNIFWMDIIQGHGLLERTPQKLKKLEKSIYNHCIKKFWETIVKMITIATRNDKQSDSIKL